MTLKNYVLINDKFYTVIEATDLHFAVFSYMKIYSLYPLLSVCEQSKIGIEVDVLRDDEYFQMLADLE